MSTVSVQVDDSGATVALGKFRLNLAQNEELMRDMGGVMLLSIAKTFREEGSPAGSWMPLAPSTVRSYGKKAAGHKLLMMSGRLFRSIRFTTAPGQVLIGPSADVRYAAVHQFGSRDRGSVGIGPRTEKMDKALVNVKEHSYTRLQNALGTGKHQMTAKSGRSYLVNRRVAGPRNQLRVSVSGHTRHQNIPARPYLVFRPEDPDRLQSAAEAFCVRAAEAAGLEGAK
jgi:phage gpG-like protein